MMSDPALTAVQQCMRLLLHAILDYLDLPDLLRAMRVSAGWQEYIINHPTYYGKLELAHKDPPGASDAFLLRLSRSHGRPISVRLVLDDLRPFMSHITSHLGHIRSLSLRQSGDIPYQPILEALCKPADILDHLLLDNMMPPPGQPTPILPAHFLSDRAPVLRKVQMLNVGFQDTMPICFGSLRSLEIQFSPNDHEIGGRGPALVVPNLFEHSPLLRELSLYDFVTLDHAGWHSRNAWERMSELMFSGYACDVWFDFQLPLSAVTKISLIFPEPAAVLALAATLPGMLELAFPLSVRRPSFPRAAGKYIIVYAAVLRSASHPDNRARQLNDIISWHPRDTAFSTPALSNRVVRLTLALEFWVNFVGLSTFGPFNALEDLTLTLEHDAKFQSEAALPGLSCARLQRLILRATGEIGKRTEDLGDVAKFALVCLPEAKFPLILAIEGLSLTGNWTDFSEVFSSCQ